MSDQKENLPKETGTSTPAVNQKPPSALVIFRKELDAFEKPIVKLLASYGYSAEKFITVVDNAIRINPDLLNCDRKSLFAGILTAAELGLEPNTPLGLCYLIPYNRKGVKLCQFQLGYQGIISLIYRIPGVETVSSERVFAKDTFEYEIFPVKKISRHIPYMPKDEKDSRGELIAVYAVIKYKDIEKPVFEIVLKEELAKIKKLSQAAGSDYSPYNSGVDVFNWMERKVAIKQIFKMVNKNYDAKTSEAMNLDTLLETGASLTMDEEGKIKIIMPDKQPNMTGSEKIKKIHEEAEDADVVENTMIGEHTEEKKEEKQSEQPQPVDAAKKETEKKESPKKNEKGLFPEAK